jgi:hypothetical protein
MGLATFVDHYPVFFALGPVNHAQTRLTLVLKFN